MGMVVLIPCNEPHCHPEIDLRDGYKDRGVRLADHLVNSEESFIMPYKCIGKNIGQIFADICKRVSWDISGYYVFDILATCKNISAISAVPGLGRSRR